jgi:choline dehydrogenase
VRFDDVVVGAGSSGGVVAARLVEAGRRVALVEAGPDSPDSATAHRTLVDGRLAATIGFDWGYVAEPRPGRPPIVMPRGRVVGGCSAINGSNALRPVPTDFASWGPGWTWDDVLPAFVALEDDPDGAVLHPDVHGLGGPIRITRFGLDGVEPDPVQRAQWAAWGSLGLADVVDHNHPDGLGWGPTPMSLDGTARQSTTWRYLQRWRDDERLTIVADALCDRVLIEDQRATGIRLVDGTELRAARVVVSAGALATPGILVRSGIGPAEDLRRLGLPVVADLPVGEALQDHPAVYLTGIPPAGTWDARSPFLPWVARLTTPGSDLPADLQLMPFNRMPPARRDLGVRHVWYVVPSVQRVRSRGRVTITSTDPTAPPHLAMRYLDHPDDLARIVVGMRLAWTVLRHPAMRAVTERVVVTDPAIDAPVAVDVDREPSDDELGALACATVQTNYHPVGTAAIGSVVDADGAVHGVAGLHVADASVMPEVVSANTNTTCLMIGERLGARLAATST